MPYYRCTACGVTSYSAAAYSSPPTCATCPAELSETSKLDLVPGARRKFSRDLSARPEAAAEARRALVGLMLPERMREDLALVVTELVNNSVLHAGLAADDPIRVELDSGSDKVRGCIHDRGSGFAPKPARATDQLAAGGRGLRIVDALSETWGVNRDSDGCTVWFEVTVGIGGAASADDVTNGYVRDLAFELAVAGTGRA